MIEKSDYTTALRRLVDVYPEHAEDVDRMTRALGGRASRPYGGHAENGHEESAARTTSRHATGEIYAH